MNDELRILILEDVPTDADLMEHELRKARLTYQAQRVDTRADFERALEAFKPDIVLADYNLPTFTGGEALEIVRRTHPEVPVIIVTGSLGGEAAVELVHQGAKDYVLKSNLARLGHAVQQALITEMGIRARKAAERQVRIAEEKYRALFVEARDGIVLTDAESGLVVDCNPEFERQCGRPLVQIKTLYTWELRPLELQEAARRKFEEVKTTGRGSDDLGFQRPNGTFMPAEIVATRVRIGDRNYLQSISRDVTERKQTEEALHESEECFRRAMETARDAIITVDGEGGVITTWNPAAEAIFGYSKEETIGRVLHEIITPPQFRETATKAMAHFATTGEGAAINKTLELPAQHKNGTEFPIELSLTAMQIRGKWFATGIAHDISERKAAEAKIQLFRNLLDHSSDGIFIVNPATGRFLDVNEAACHDLGYTRDELLQRCVVDIQTIFRDTAAWQAHVQELRARGHAILEFGALRKDGNQFPVEASLKYVTIVNQDYIIAVVRDISERKVHEAKIINLNRALRTLSTCNVALVHAQTEDELFQNVCRHIVKTGDYLLAWVEYPAEAEGGEPRFGAYFGDEAAYRLHAELALRPEHASHCLTAAALRTRQIQPCNNLHETPECSFDPLREVGVQSILALPLLHNNDVQGVLTIFSSVPDSFGTEEIKLMEELAGDLAYGIVTLRTRNERDQAVEGERKQSVKLREALEQTIAAIALTLEKRDPYTAGHQQRVAEIASAIATEMSLSPHQIEGIRFGALIHDIGKVYVPAEILNRPGKLSDLEFGLIKMHSQVGYDIVKDIPFPWPVAQMVLQHHERLDGSGYPQGLKGDEITLEARILAVADVVEAMGAHRPYRAALGPEAAVTELAQGRGTAYDAAVVDACLKLVKENRCTFA